MQFIDRQNPTRYSGSDTPLLPIAWIGVSAVGQSAGCSASPLNGDAKMIEEFVPLSEVRNFVDEAGVYEITCPEKGRVYIGMSTSITRRVLSHLDDLTGDRHSNKLLQRDWNALTPDDFMFKMVKAIPYTEVRELSRAERSEIELRRKHGVQLYNDFRLTKNTDADPQTVALIEDEEERRALKREKRNAEKRKQHIDRLLNGPYYRPKQAAKKKYEQATCYDCGVTGGVNDRLFRCDDGMIRCETCVDKHLGSLAEWVNRERETQPRRIGPLRRRWRMYTENYAREVKLALASFKRKFRTVPPKVYFSHKFSGNLTKMERKLKLDIELARNDVTPQGYIDMPIPVEDE